MYINYNCRCFIQIKNLVFYFKVINFINFIDTCKYVFFKVMKYFVPQLFILCCIAIYYKGSYLLKYLYSYFI